MTDVVICYVRQSNGKYKKYRSKDGANFISKKGPDRGKSYNAPNIDNFEIFETKNWLGTTKRQSFYRINEPDAIPLNKKGVWKPKANHDNDIAILVEVTAAALRDTTNADMKANAALVGQGLVLLAIFLHQVLG